MIETCYDGNRQLMVDRLRVSKSWLGRYLELAKLAAETIAAFGSPYVIEIEHAEQLVPSPGNQQNENQENLCQPLREALEIGARQRGPEAAQQFYEKPAAVVKWSISGTKTKTP